MFPAITIAAIVVMMYFLRRAHQIHTCDNCQMNVRRFFKTYGRIKPITRATYECKHCGHKSSEWLR
jgi:hypothetical protein